MSKRVDAVGLERQEKRYVYRFKKQSFSKRGRPTELNFERGKSGRKKDFC